MNTGSIGVEIWVYDKGLNISVYKMPRLPSLFPISMS